MKKIVLGCFFLFLLSDCQGQKPLSDQEKDSLRVVFQNRLENYLQKEGALNQFLEIHSEGIRLYFLEENQKKINWELSWESALVFRQLLIQNPEKAYLYYQERKTSEIPSTDLDLFTSDDKSQTKPDQKLSGLRIALDPGHLAGSLSEAIQEGKYIRITLPSKQKISFFESELAWYTSRILADTLEKLGAEVLLTRDEYHLTALDSSYTDWFENYRQNHPNSTIDKWQFFHKEFKKIDFNKRIEKINRFKPDLTLIIHYNVDATNTGWQKTTHRNNSMAFVGGSFMSGEFEQAQNQFHLLRLLLSEDIPRSVLFSQKILQALENELHIKPIPEKNEQFFLNQYCLYTGEPGIYHRNLTLTRQVYGTLCYAEPLYQDNASECLRLYQRDEEYQGYKISGRVKEVAFSYLKGILDYVQGLK
ncbi:MAG: hypothetical protein NW226_12575 [Microscillaceae bacterium]|nr:hypothetical protein [Microscillaceae bacterium]